MKSLKINKKQLAMVILAFIPFVAMDIIVRAIGKKITIEIGLTSTTFFPLYSVQPLLFTLVFAALFIGISLCLPKILSRIAYIVFFLISYTLFVTNLIYYNLSSYYFSFSLMSMTGEASSYMLDTIKNTPIYMYVLMVIILLLGIFCIIKLPTGEKFSLKGILFIIAGFVILHGLLPLSFGFKKNSLRWDSFRNPRSIYHEFSDVNKSMKMTGLYEYEARNFYITFLRPDEKISVEDKAFLDTVHDSSLESPTNAYTGLFEGKNLILLQLEGIDSFLLDEETMPNLYALKNASIDFVDHFSIYSGGGSTFNSEFAVNVGFTTPISYEQNVYLLNKNTFPHTLPKMFKEKGYTVNAFHMNSAEFYNRGLNYSSWGYDSYNSLLDNGDYSDTRYDLDRELIVNETFYNKIFNKEQPFVDYIISYTPHTPFTIDKGVGKLLYEDLYGTGAKPAMTEEEIARMEAGETDRMIGLLIDGLKSNGLFENTVIIAFADHYLYTLQDKSILDKYKDTSGNLVNRTPFFIFANGVTSEIINKPTNQMTILPTTLNLFGISYNPSDYLMTDALSDDYDGLVYFKDQSWYDGNVYVENGVIKNDGILDSEAIREKEMRVNQMIRNNDLTLRYDYFKKSE